MTAPVPEGDVKDVKRTLARLSVAFGLWAEATDPGECKKQGEKLINKAIDDWNSICELPCDSPIYSTVGNDLDQLEALCQEFMGGRRTQWPQHNACFLLGLEMVQVEDASYDEPKAKKPKWAWRNPKRVQSLLKQAGLEKDDIFPETVPDDDPVHDELPKHWSKWEKTIGWLHLEVGLRNLQETIKPPPAGRRRSFDRDHEFLEWYEEKDTPTWHRPTKIRDQWNERHPTEKVTVDVVKQGLKKAKRERHKKK